MLAECGFINPGCRTRAFTYDLAVVSFGRESYNQAEIGARWRREYGGD